MKINKKYLIALIIIALLLFGLYNTANPWVWLAIVIISGLLPVRMNRQVKWHYFHYFGCAAVAMTIFYLASPPEPEILEAMGKLFYQLGSSLYLVAVGIVTAACYALLALTVAAIAGVRRKNKA